MASASSSSRVNNFNLIRLLLASSVILAHSPELIDGNRGRELAARLWGDWVSLGVLAVDGFFLLSGFLIAQSWDHDPRLLPYLRKRTLRIYPGFLVACLICYLGLANLGDNPHYWSDFKIGPFFRGLLILDPSRAPGAFLHQPISSMNGSTWTIRYEFLLYLGLAAIGMLGLLRRRWLLLALTLSAAVWTCVQSLGLTPLLAVNKLTGSYVTEIPRLLSCFLAGSTFHTFRDRLRFSPPLLIGAGLSLACCLFREWAAALAVPFLGGYLLLAAGLASPVPGTGWVRREDISYGTYLYAWPVQQLVILNYRQINPWLLCVVTLCLAMLAGWASWRFFEQPFLKWKGNRVPPTRF